MMETEFASQRNYKAASTDSDKLRPPMDLHFVLRRAEEEAIKVIAADRTTAGNAHFELSLRYSEFAVAELSREFESLRRSTIKD